MTRTINKVLAVLGISGFAMFQVGGCESVATEFLKGVDLGYQAQTGESLLGGGEDLGVGYDDGFGDDIGFDDGYGFDDSYGWDEGCDVCSGYDDGYFPW